MTLHSPGMKLIGSRNFFKIGVTMRIYKTTYKDKDGKTRTARKWYIETRDHLGIIRRFAGSIDKTATEGIGRQIEALVRYKAAGEQPDPQLTQWLEQTPERFRTKLAKIGILDSRRAAAGKPLTKHLEDFKASLQAKENTKKHVKDTFSRAKKIIEGCKFRTWTDIQADRIQRYLVELRNDGEGISAQTFNYYLQSIKQFCKWMKQNQRASESPIEHLRGLNARTDRRRERRALEPDEMRKLWEATVNTKKRFNMTGYERALLYRLAAETGLRANELRSLKVSSFDFDNCTITAKAAYSKRRREDTLPLRKDTAEAIKILTRGKTPNVQVFKVPDKSGKMIEADLAEAGIAYVDESGRYADFHSLRHTTGSLLAASGVNPKVAQSIMRHSDINLTMSKYTHLFRGQETEAIDSLPDLSAPSSQRQIKTGTDDEKNSALNSAFLLGQHSTAMDNIKQATPPYSSTLPQPSLT
ncbi:MAG: site-specific integrase, partial [Candidatus Mariimomonas ferrooxydans]